MRRSIKLIFISCVASLIAECQKPPTIVVPITVQSPNGAHTDPNVLSIRDDQADKDGKVIVKWTQPQSQPWLVQFADDTPCGKNHVIQSGTKVESCTLRLKKMQLGFVYKYSAHAGQAHVDPGIAHEGTPLGPDKSQMHAVSASQITSFCLDISAAAPGSCNDGDPPPDAAAANPLNVSPADSIFFKADGSWTITMPPAACTRSKISSQTPFCVVKSTAGSCGAPGSFCTYNYSVTMNGATKGPYKLQVKGQ